MDVKRGPKLGDAASLWNFTASPGWTKEEANLLRLCLMKYGVSAWLQIQATGLLPGKTVQQLTSQAQRLLGQQSLAPFAGLPGLDVDAVRRDNDARLADPRVARKNGLVVRSGPNPTREMREAWRAESRRRYGLSEARAAEVDAELRGAAAAAAARAGAGAAAAGAPTYSQCPHEEALATAAADGGADPRALPRDVVAGALLPLLRARLAALLRALEEAAEVAVVGSAAGAADDATPSSTPASLLLQELRALAAERARASAAVAAEPPPPPAPQPRKKAATATAVVSLTAVAATAQKQKKQQQQPKRKKAKADAAPTAAATTTTTTTAAAARRTARRPSALSSSSSSCVREADVAALAAMGFSRKSARDALAEVGPGALDEAVAWLLAGG